MLSNKGILKVADFGLARHFGTPLRPYTPTVVTLWYRAPELLLGAREYSSAIDMWSVGCIFAEMLTRTPLLRSRGELEQLDQIFRVLGTPTEAEWPGYTELPDAKKMRFKSYAPSLRQRMFSATTEAGLDLLSGLLALNPSKRLTARAALSHRYFRESPLPREAAMIQTFPSLHDGRPLPHHRRDDLNSDEPQLFVPARELDKETELLGLDPYGQQAPAFKLKF